MGILNLKAERRKAQEDWEYVAVVKKGGKLNKEQEKAKKVYGSKFVIKYE